MAQRPLNRAGNKAASLSSGGMTTPLRSKALKSRIDI
jgi:hypothetical protein